MPYHNKYNQRDNRFQNKKYQNRTEQLILVENKELEFRAIQALFEFKIAFEKILTIKKIGSFSLYPRLESGS